MLHYIEKKDSNGKNKKSLLGFDNFEALVDVRLESQICS